MSFDKMKMAELRAAAKEKDITVPFGTKKDALIALLEGGETQAPEPQVVIRTEAPKKKVAMDMPGEDPLKHGYARVMIHSGGDKNNRPVFLGGERTVYAPRGKKVDISASHYEMLQHAVKTETQFDDNGKVLGKTDVASYPFQTFATNFA